MKKLTLQQIFDRAVLGVVEQGAFAALPHNGACRYRLKVGNKTLACGVGQLIKPENYDPFAEGVGVRTLRALVVGRPTSDDDFPFRLGAALALSGVDVTDKQTVSLLANLQVAHDQAAQRDNMSMFITSARRIARRRGLEMPHLPKCTVGVSV